MRFRNDTSFLVWMLQMVECCVRFSHVSSSGTQISCLHVFPIRLRRSWIVEHDTFIHVLNLWCCDVDPMQQSHSKLCHSYQAVFMERLIRYVPITIFKPLIPQLVLNPDTRCKYSSLLLYQYVSLITHTVSNGKYVVS